MEIHELRSEIDKIDDELLRLFCARMGLCAQVADYKRERGLPIYVPAREREILQSVAQKAQPEFSDYARSLYSTIFELSRCYQAGRTGRQTALFRKITAAIENTPRLFPRSAMVACQGVEGAYSQLACEKIFPNPMILYFKNFQGVFTAIEKGMCTYGILPIENSTAGSVNQVYDLMIQHNFSIVRTFRLKVDHNLLAAPGARLEDIREIYSHQQAISQCSRFLTTVPNAAVTAVDNTAAAAEMVARSGRRDVAAICSRSCAQLYGLENIAPGIQDRGDNRTRFICISRNLEIYPGADKTSIMMILPHKPGALYRVLARIYTLGINVTKLESRPLPDREFEFMFYFDLETSVYSQEFVQLMCELDDFCEEFKYLGSFSEVV